MTASWITASGTITPLSVHPARVRLSVTNQYLNFHEIMAISTAGQIISSSKLGSVGAFNGPQYDATFAAFRGNDLFMDPAGAGGSLVAHSLSTTGLVAYDLNFQPAPLAAVWIGELTLQCPSPLRSSSPIHLYCNLSSTHVLPACSQPR